MAGLQGPASRRNSNSIRKAGQKGFDPELQSQLKKGLRKASEDLEKLPLDRKAPRSRSPVSTIEVHDAIANEKSDLQIEDIELSDNYTADTAAVRSFMDLPVEEKISVMKQMTEDDFRDLKSLRNNPDLSFDEQYDVDLMLTNFQNNHPEFQEYGSKSPEENRQRAFWQIFENEVARSPKSIGVENPLPSLAPSDIPPEMKSPSCMEALNTLQALAQLQHKGTGSDTLYQGIKLALNPEQKASFRVSQTENPNFEQINESISHVERYLTQAYNNDRVGIKKKEISKKTRSFLDAFKSRKESAKILKKSKDDLGKIENALKKELIFPNKREFLSTMQDIKLLNSELAKVAVSSQAELLSFGFDNPEINESTITADQVFTATCLDHSEELERLSPNLGVQNIYLDANNLQFLPFSDDWESKGGTELFKQGMDDSDLYITQFKHRTPTRSGDAIKAYTITGSQLDGDTKRMSLFREREIQAMSDDLPSIHYRDDITMHYNTEGSWVDIQKPKLDGFSGTQNHGEAQKAHDILKSYGVVID